MENKIKNLIDAIDGRVGFVHALQSKWFGTQWTMNGEDYSNLKWLDSNKIPKPTKSEIDAEVVRLQAEYDAKQYQRDRRYPEIGEQLDMLWHAIDSDALDKSCDFFKTLKKVKDDNPKPEQKKT